MEYFQTRALKLRNLLRQAKIEHETTADPRNAKAVTMVLLLSDSS